MNLSDELAYLGMFGEIFAQVSVGLSEEKC